MQNTHTHKCTCADMSCTDTHSHYMLELISTQSMQPDTAQITEHTTNSTQHTAPVTHNTRHCDVPSSSPPKLLKCYHCWVDPCLGILMTQGGTHALACCRRVYISNSSKQTRKMQILRADIKCSWRAGPGQRSSIPTPITCVS